MEPLDLVLDGGVARDAALQRCHVAQDDARVRRRLHDLRPHCRSKKKPVKIQRAEKPLEHRRVATAWRVSKEKSQRLSGETRSGTVSFFGCWRLHGSPRTERKADSSTLPASLVRMQVYLPASAARTAAMSSEPSSRICMRPDGTSTVVSVAGRHFVGKETVIVGAAKKYQRRQRKKRKVRFRTASVVWNTRGTRVRETR